jgi:hypothetical protein
MKAPSPARIDEEFEERAAIMEYDGGIPRDRAERLAKEYLWQTREKQAQAPLFA